ncbi:hypothetical protein ANANG_G00006520 [Anguilla anguilla]|uniref:Rap-GAP domain-containing protein n=1 Tax=Anguilla anguilla TaxID=7936 RepID=A0A9D3MZ02_ANGAN|nr:hypothetical protein ANANG_G00006520 [Anguilla anguilla]
MEKERRNDKFFSRKRSFTFGAYGGVDRFICEARQESIERSILDILDSPTNETKSVLTATTNQRSTDLFEIIEKLQGSRLDEQRCAFPPPLKMLCESVTVSQFEAVSYLKAPELITAFDEHRVSQNFKFGVLYQKEGQLTEEDILSNNEESEEFQAFLSILGETVKLQGFTGFRGGLDVCHGQTGSDAVVTSFHGREIMFHVATKLPFTEGDTQQLQRKRHIGNDIVALVYQEGPAPFISDIISSHFLHCFIVVRRMPKGSRGEEAKGATFQVSVTAREDVPPFGPPLPDPPIFTECPGFREFLLTKLINAEISCYKAERFSRLELRTRSSLLEGLRSELSSQSQCMLGEPTPPALALSDGVRGGSEGGGGFIENFKRAIRVRSHSFDTLGVPKKTGIGGPPQKPRVFHGTSPGADKEGESESTNKQSGPNLQLNGSPNNGDGKGQNSPQEDE